MLTGVIFDLDGTLIDSAADLAGAYNALRVSQSLASLPLDILKPKVAYGTIELICEDFSVSTNDTLYTQLRKTFTQFYTARMTKKTRLFAGIAAMLSALKRRHIPWAIVTNKPKRFALPIIQYFPILHDACCVVCRDTLEVCKPHPRPLQYACQQMSIAPARAVMVGDTQTDVQAARNAGMPAMVVGYAYQNKNDIARWQADVILQHPKELLPWLLQYPHKENAIA